MPDNFIFDEMVKKFTSCMESELAEDFLMILLQLMGIVLLLNSDYRRNIIGFKGRYQFRSSDDAITVAAVFDNDSLSVNEELIEDPNISVTFKDGKALMNYILSPKPDVLGSMLRQEVSLDGNLNYLYRFAYMAKRLQLMASGGL
ncbi:MAG: hypothetical protein HXX11_01610 [Desulfuromonadales bacterium]|nr:hypothetical protein [Desulfuromonadales bacterium]